MTRPHPLRADPRRRQRGSVLIIVLWICLGLVTLILYFANSIDSELQAAANRVGEIEARQAVAAGTRYAAYILNNYAIDGVVPDNGIAPDPTSDYYSEALQVGDESGDPQFWFIGRDGNNPPTTDPVFGLVDEVLEAQPQHRDGRDARSAAHGQHDARFCHRDRDLADPAIAVRRRAPPTTSTRRSTRRASTRARRSNRSTNFGSFTAPRWTSFSARTPTSTAPWIPTRTTATNLRPTTTRTACCSPACSNMSRPSATSRTPPSRARRA